MKSYHFEINENFLPFSYKDFRGHYRDVGLKEYVKSILVIQNLSVKAQKKFLLSQIPYLKKVDPCKPVYIKKLYLETIGDDFIKYDISPLGACESRWCYRNGEEDKGFLSFFKYLLQAQSYLEAFVFIDNHLQIVRSSFSDIQKRLFSNLCEIKHPYYYVSLIDQGLIVHNDWFKCVIQNIVERLEYSNVISCSVNRIYCEWYRTGIGRDVFILTSGEEVVSIARSLFYDNDLEHPCMSLFEDNTLLLYNYQEIERYQDRNIVISERYEWINSCCNCLSDDFPNSVLTWLNPEKKISDKDWSYLIKRDVTFVFQQDSADSANRALKLYKLCKEKNIKLTFVAYYYEGDERSSKWWHKGKNLSIEELRDFLRTHAENDQDNAKSCNSSDIKKPSDLEADTKLYLVETLFRPGDIVLLVAKQKVGKSLFSLDLSMMLSIGGAMGDRLKAPKAQQVLYVDAEMPSGEVKKRIDQLKINYEQSDLLDQNLGFFFPRENRKRLNLLLEDDQSLIEHYLVDRKLLVLDNLGKMLPVRGEVNEKQWGDFFLWLEKISSKGITVLLVHHENKVGGHRGTGKITDDVDLVLSLKKVEGKEEDSNAIELTIDDSRFLHGKDCKPFVLEYCKDAQRLVYSVEVERKQKLPLNKADLSVVKDYLTREKLGYSALTERHLLILAPLCSGARIYVTRKDFDDQLGVGVRSVQNLLTELCGYGVLVSEGSLKATKYKLASPAAL